MSEAAAIGALSVNAARRRGGPLAMLGVLLGGWTIARSVLWQSPFVLPEVDLAMPPLFAESAPRAAQPKEASVRVSGPLAEPNVSVWTRPYSNRLLNNGLNRDWGDGRSFSRSSDLSSGHQRLMSQAFAVDWHSPGVARGFGGGFAASGEGVDLSASLRTPSAVPPVFGQISQREPQRPDRWWLDSFAFIRQGSGSLSTSQGRMPVYGASQVGANLQYRIAPRSGFDPRGYVRAYRALVDAGETEVAAGLSARPIPPVPVRLQAETRVSRNPVGTDYRPAAYLVSELPAQGLPLGLSLETYAAAGYVGGESDTYFADGQATVTREVITLDGPTGRPIRLSVGGGGWGGLQRGAERVDVGPTMRVDLNVGEVPARISVDWRERVAGEAEPSSGLAATVSTRF